MPTKRGDLPETWYARLDALLTRKGQGSGKALAAKLKVDDTQVSHFRAGRRVPNAEELIAICDHFDVSADWLLGTTHNPGVPQQLVAKAVEHLAAAQEALGVAARARAGAARTEEKGSTRAKRGGSE